ncbi:MAG: DUF3365 domain-containing protein [Gammaproteobacteria bacterium]|nr:DUF3365 domain-containing protein [Gammaproteobacteria bacterium]
MKRFLLIALTATISIAPAYADNHLKQRAMESKTVVKEFMGQLKGELQAAMKAGGPGNAINVCKESAPLIAKNLSDKYGWKVARTSLKTRNPNNAPDAWEADVLRKFEARKQAGEDVKPMAYFAEVEDKGSKSFRFMKAIPTGEACLKCHGTNIDAKVVAKLDATYPEDKARGFKLGDIRGAFTIVQPIN